MDCVLILKCISVIDLGVNIQDKANQQFLKIRFLNLMFI